MWVINFSLLGPFWLVFYCNNTYANFIHFLNTFWDYLVEICCTPIVFPVSKARERNTSRDAWRIVFEVQTFSHSGTRNEHRKPFFLMSSHNYRHLDVFCAHAYKISMKVYIVFKSINLITCFIWVPQFVTASFHVFS